MTPKEKAIELVNNFKFEDVVTEKLQVVNIDIYSQLFALRAVDEIKKAGIHLFDQMYWDEVKKEIEKL
jgi:hypothetical protein